jgi:hypothetical protein
MRRLRRCLALVLCAATLGYAAPAWAQPQPGTDPKLTRLAGLDDEWKPPPVILEAPLAAIGLCHAIQNLPTNPDIAKLKDFGPAIHFAPAEPRVKITDRRKDVQAHEAMLTIGSQTQRVKVVFVGYSSFNDKIIESFEVKNPCKERALPDLWIREQWSGAPKSRLLGNLEVSVRLLSNEGYAVVVCANGQQCSPKASVAAPANPPTAPAGSAPTPLTMEFQVVGLSDDAVVFEAGLDKALRRSVVFRDANQKDLPYKIAKSSRVEPYLELGVVRFVVALEYPSSAVTMTYNGKPVPCFKEGGGNCPTKGQGATTPLVLGLDPAFRADVGTPLPPVIRRLRVFARVLIAPTKEAEPSDVRDWASEADKYQVEMTTGPDAWERITGIPSYETRNRVKLTERHPVPVGALIRIVVGPNKTPVGEPFRVGPTTDEATFDIIVPELQPTISVEIVAHKRFYGQAIPELHTDYVGCQVTIRPASGEGPVALRDIKRVSDVAFSRRDAFVSDRLWSKISGTRFQLQFTADPERDKQGLKCLPVTVDVDPSVLNTLTKGDNGKVTIAMTMPSRDRWLLAVINQLYLDDGRFDRPGDANFAEGRQRLFEDLLTAVNVVPAKDFAAVDVLLAEGDKPGKSPLENTRSLAGGYARPAERAPPKPIKFDLEDYARWRSLGSGSQEAWQSPAQGAAAVINEYAGLHHYGSAKPPRRSLAILVLVAPGGLSPASTCNAVDGARQDVLEKSNVTLLTFVLARGKSSKLTQGGDLVEPCVGNDGKPVTDTHVVHFLSYAENTESVRQRYADGIRNKIRAAAAALPP